MGVIQAFSGALGGTLADQWKDIIVAGHFDEFTVVAPGVRQQSNAGRGTNFKGSVDVITSGSKFFIPENTAAFIFSQAGIEDVIWESGGYEYQAGLPSVFNGDGFAASIVKQTVDRFKFGGQTDAQTYLAFVNLREIRGIKFGTRSPLVYHDRFYGTDLELLAFGTFALKVVNPLTFVQNFLPPNSRYYSFSSAQARQQISSEFMQAFTAAVNSLSATHRISELPSQVGTLAELIADDTSALGSWIDRYGLDVVQVGIESIEFTPESRELVKQYSANKMNLTAFEDISQQASNVAAQQRIAAGVEQHGLGDGAGLIFGMGLASSLNPATGAPVGQPAAGAASTVAAPPSLDEQIEAVKKLKDLLDAGILSQEEFDTKKKQVMGL